MLDRFVGYDVGVGVVGYKRCDKHPKNACKLQATDMPKQIRGLCTYHARRLACDYVKHLTRATSKNTINGLMKLTVTLSTCCH